MFDWPLVVRVSCGVFLFRQLAHLGHKGWLRTLEEKSVIAFLHWPKCEWATGSGFYTFTACEDVETTPTWEPFSTPCERSGVDRAVRMCFCFQLLQALVWCGVRWEINALVLLVSWSLFSLSLANLNHPLIHCWIFPRQLIDSDWCYFTAQQYSHEEKKSHTMLSKASPLKYPRGSYLFCLLQIPCVWVQLISFQTHVVLLSCMWISAQHSSERCAFTLPCSSISLDFFFFFFAFARYFASVTIILLSPYLRPRAIWTWTPGGCEPPPNFVLKACEYRFLGLPQRAETMPMPHWAICFLFARPPAPLHRSPKPQTIHLILSWPFKKCLQIDFVTRLEREEEGEGGTATCTPRLRGLFPSLTDGFWGVHMTVVSHNFRGLFRESISTFSAVVLQTQAAHTRLQEQLLLNQYHWMGSVEE